MILFLAPERDNEGRKFTLFNRPAPRMGMAAEKSSPHALRATMAYRLAHRSAPKHAGKSSCNSLAHLTRERQEILWDQVQKSVRERGWGGGQ